MLDAITACIMANPFRPFYVSTTTSTYRIDRPDQIEISADRESITVPILNQRERIDLSSIKFLGPA